MVVHFTPVEVPHLEELQVGEAEEGEDEDGHLQTQPFAEGEFEFKAIDRKQV